MGQEERARLNHQAERLEVARSEEFAEGLRDAQMFSRLYLL